MTGYDVYFIIVVLGILITIYTVMGDWRLSSDGRDADHCAADGGVLCIWIVFAKVPESTGEMLAYAWNSKKFSLADPDPTHVYAYTLIFFMKRSGSHAVRFVSEPAGVCLRSDPCTTLLRGKTRRSGKECCLAGRAGVYPGMGNVHVCGNLIMAILSAISSSGCRKAFSAMPFFLISS